MNFETITIKHLETMRKTIIAIAALAMFTIGNSFAQNGGFKKDHRDTREYTNHRNEPRAKEYQIDRLDDIVKLTNKQEREMKKIENRYDRLASKNRKSVTLQQIKRLEIQKQQEILSVLTQKQHERLMSYERTQRNNRQDVRSNRRG